MQELPAPLGADSRRESRFTNAETSAERRQSALDVSIMITAFKQRFRAFLRWALSHPIVQKVLRPFTHAGLAPEAFWKRLPVEAVFAVSLPGGGSFLYSSIPDHLIGRSLFWRGLQSHEGETAKVFVELAKASEVVVIVGANTGLYALLACAVNPQCKVVCFEPVPDTYKRLVENVAINGWQERCELHSDAVSNAVGLARFHVPSGQFPGSASLNPGGFRGYAGFLIEVPVTTVDTVCSRFGRVDLVLVDVEGFEDRVLEGMQVTIGRAKPAIIIECLPDGPFQAVDKLLTRFGYRFQHLGDAGPVPMDRIVPDSSERYRNYLCMPKQD